MEEKRRGILKGLEKELEEIKDEIAGYDARYGAATKVLDQLKSGAFYYPVKLLRLTNYVVVSSSMPKLIQRQLLRLC